MQRSFAGFKVNIGASNNQARKTATFRSLSSLVRELPRLSAKVLRSFGTPEETRLGPVVSPSLFLQFSPFSSVCFQNLPNPNLDIKAPSYEPFSRAFVGREPLNAASRQGKARLTTTEQHVAARQMKERGTGGQKKLPRPSCW